MKKNTLWLIVVVIVGILIIFQYRLSDPSGETIKIGAILSLSGNTSSFYGEYNKNALEIAKNKLNESGGVLGKQVEIIYENSQGDKQLAASAIQKLINVDGVKFVISDITASSLAIAPIAESNKVILIATSASTPDLTASGDYIFRTKLASTIEGKEAAQYISTNLNPNRVAFLYQNKDYGIGVFKKFSEELKRENIDIVSEQKYETGATDMRQQLLNIKEKKPDLIIIAGFPKEMGVLIKQARELGLTTKFFAHSGSIGPDIELIAGKQADGLMYLSELDQTTPEFAAFADIHQQKYSKQPELFASNAYDALMLITKSIRDCASTNTACIKEKLYETQNYKGVSGSISYDSNGDLTNRSMVCRKKVYSNSKLTDMGCDQ